MGKLGTAKKKQEAGAEAGAKMMNFVLQTSNFALNNDEFCSSIKGRPGGEGIGGY